MELKKEDLLIVDPGFIDNVRDITLQSLSQSEKVKIHEIENKILENSKLGYTKCHIETAGWTKKIQSIFEYYGFKFEYEEIETTYSRGRYLFIKWF